MLIVTIVVIPKPQSIKYPNTSVRNKIKKHLMKSVESFESIAKFRIVKLNVDVDPN